MGPVYTLLHLVDAINRVLGTNIEPCFAAARVGDVQESLADIRRAGKLLDYRPSVDFAEGLQRTIDYFRGHSLSDSRRQNCRTDVAVRY